jgi:type I restriction enzyme M protein
MLTGEIRGQIGRIWDTFWSGGISNPLEVIEQITYLLFLKRLDELETAEELKASRDKKAETRRFFPTGKDSKKRLYQDFRWSHFKNFEPREMYAVINDHVFPWLRTLGGNGTTYSHHMEGARFTIPTPALLAKVVDMIDKVPMEDRDTKGDLYEYMLGKIATAGQNGQFRTPRHIIRLMVEMVEPTPKDIVCDPACGTCGFLVAVGESLRDNHKEVLTNAKLHEHFHHHLFHGFDFDNTMLRIGSMALLRHEKSFTKWAEDVREIAGALNDKASIPMVRAELELIIEVQTDEFWQDITTTILEDVRKTAAELGQIC